MKNNHTPEIRFPGFIGDWEQRKLGNISTKIGSGKTPKGGDTNYKSAGIPLLRSQNIFNDKVNFNDVVYITPEIDKNMANSRVQKGDVLLNITGASIGRSAVYKSTLRANVNQHVSIIRPVSEVNPYFIQLNLTSEKGQKQIELNQAGGGREGLNFQQIAKMSFYFPSLEEQDNLEHFFMQLNNIIDLHQQELTILKQTKQGFLQKMFPKEGESLPEVRFPGFSGEWEERKFSNIVNRVSNQSNDTNLPRVEFEDIISGEGRLNKDISQKFDDRKGIVFEPNFILFGKLRPYLKNWLFPNFKGIALGDFWVFEPNNSSSIFNYYLIQTDKYQMVANLSTGTKMPRSDWKTVSETEFRVPKIEEQLKIGNFFKQLDETITLHQRELDCLKETKKAFLQKMFA